MTHEHDRKRDKPTGGPQPAEVAEGLADSAPGAFDTLAPEVLRLPGREPIDVRGRSVEDVIGMIRDACRAPDRANPDAFEVPSGPLSPDDVLITDVTTPGGWIIIGCGDEKGERGFIVEGTTKPSRSGDVADTEGETGNEPREKTSVQPSEP